MSTIVSLLSIIELLSENSSLVKSEGFNPLSSSFKSKIKSLGTSSNLRFQGLPCAAISKLVNSKAKVKLKSL